MMATGYSAEEIKLHLIEVGSPGELENRLRMSRDEVAEWFHKSLAHETELESVKGVNKLLKQKLDDQQKTIDELRRKYDRSNVATFRKRERDETISELT